MWIGYREQTPTAPEVFSAAAILISAPKKLVSMAEIIMPALGIGVSVSEIIISTMQITASLISIMMCGRDMIVSVAEITVSLVAMIGGVFSILISATEISISVMEISISVRQVRNLLILGLHWPAGNKLSARRR